MLRHYLHVDPMRLTFEQYDEGLESISMLLAMQHGGYQRAEIERRAHLRGLGV